MSARRQIQQLVREVYKHKHNEKLARLARKQAQARLQALMLELTDAHPTHHEIEAVEFGPGSDLSELEIQLLRFLHEGCDGRMSRSAIVSGAMETKRPSRPGLAAFVELARREFVIEHSDGWEIAPAGIAWLDEHPEPIE